MTDIYIALSKNAILGVLGAGTSFEKAASHILFVEPTIKFPGNYPDDTIAWQSVDGIYMVLHFRVVNDDR